jgi:crotonobetainyl-CoA:carnitine CoA-transferase CaiB-like acyl-CoA transferase
MRERTGRGQHIDLGMLRALVATDDYSHHLLDEELPPERLGGQVFDAPGGPILVSAQWKGVWHQLRTLFGVEAEPADTLDEKLANKRRAAREWVAAHPTREALARDLDRAGLPWGDVRRMDEVLDSPTLRSVALYGDVDDRGGGKRRVIQAPYEFSHAASGIQGPAPRRGEHNVEVLEEWLALDAAEIDRLRGAGVLLEEADLSA